MINPKNDLFVWGPIDGKPIYVDYFVYSMAPFKDYLSAGWPEIYTYVSEGKVTCIADNKELCDAGEILFKDNILNDKILKKEHLKWLRLIKDLVSFQLHIRKQNIRTKKQAKRLYLKWSKLFIRFWILGFIYEVGNWGGERMLKDYLKSEKDFNKIFEVLAAPQKLSFFQKEELELLKIKLDGLDYEKRLDAHQRKYFWLHTSYDGPTILERKYFEDILKKTTAKEARDKINEITDLPKNTLQKKQDILVKYNLSKEIEVIAKKLSFCIWAQDYRKQFTWQALHIIDLFISSFSRLYDIPQDDMKFYTHIDLLSLVKKDLKVENIKDRKTAFLENYHDGVVEYTFGKKAKDIFRPYQDVKIDKDTKELKGLVVSSGHAKGKVKILLTPKNLKKMNKGDILVAPMTSPDYIVAMRKASAIITDVGGMTSHAAIVSRELKIPCIVGTKIATKILKDSDLVEVDADKGVVRKVK